MKATILWIERGNNSTHFLSGLRKKGFNVTTAASGKLALAQIEESQPDILVIHLASFKTGGARIVNRLRQTRLPLLLIYAPAQAPLDSGAADHLVLPFTSRKLVNRVSKIIGAADQQLNRGPLLLDLAHHTLQLNGNRSDLTPRTMRLLQILLDHPGEVLGRAQLYRIGWETDYVDDLRSLDVHISWLRKALGPDHQHLLKTIRGIGYRLDV
jgi:DNA-binding response OmpR family regulator